MARSGTTYRPDRRDEDADFGRCSPEPFSEVCVTQAHTTRAHATLAPSASHRWMHCPASVRATAGMPDDTSEAAAEGTAAHELCAHCLETREEPGKFLGMWVDIKATDPAKRFLDSPFDTPEENRFFEIDEEMVDGVSLYVEHVLSFIPPEEVACAYGDVVLEVEQRLDMTHLHPEIFGTGDATMYDVGEQHLHVVDFKYGKGIVVEVDSNPQLLLYAAGAARRHHNQKIRKLTVHIVQPRASHPKGPIRSYEIDLLDLFEFEDELAKAAAATDDPNAAFNAGPWCHDTFCKLQATCPANRAYRLEAAGAEFGSVDIETKFPEPEGLTSAQRAKVLLEADGLLAFVKAVQQKAHDDALAGRMPEGFKLVAKRANRKWKDEAAVVEHLTGKIGHRKEFLYHEPKLKSPAQAESLFPGSNKEKRQAAMADLVVKQSSGVNLVPLSHPGVPVQVGAGADFESVEV